MKRLSTSLGVAVVLAFVLAACGGGSAKGKDPNAQLFAHLDAMIAILDEHRADPAKAMKELTAYEEKHGAEVQKLQQRLADFMQKDPMKAMPVASAYGMRSTRLEGMKAEMAAKNAAK